MTEDKHKGLPVEGYVDQTSDNVALVNANKILEERVLRQIEGLRSYGDNDPRMLALATTKAQEAFMWMNRAVFRPGRAKLPEDAEF